MENVFQQCVGEARDRGVTVLLSSHILAETEALCDRVTIIRAGRTVESGTLDSMRHLSRTSIKAELPRCSPAICDPDAHVEDVASQDDRTAMSTSRWTATTWISSWSISPTSASRS